MYVYICQVILQYILITVSVILDNRIIVKL